MIIVSDSKKNILKLAVERMQSQGKRLPKRMPRMLYPHSVERYYKNNLLEMVSTIQELVKNHIIPNLPHLVEQHGKHIPSQQNKKDSASDDFDELLSSVRVQYLRTYTEAELEAMASKVGEDVDDWQQRQFNDFFGKILDIDVLSSEPWLADVMDNYVSDNVRLIRSVPDRYFNEIEGVVRDGFRSGATWQDIAADLEARGGVAESRSELIARDQVGKLQGQLNQERQENLGVQKYIWRTSMDERVRDEHAEREGVEFAWDDPPEDGNPGEPIQCRCYAEPVLPGDDSSDDDSLDDSE